MITLRPVARIHTVFPQKFGIPRQSGLTSLPSRILFEPAYRNPDAVRGLSEYSHIWLIWYISELDTGRWSPTVRPPRLGGHVRKGVFASRTPHRPNPIGLSCVRLLSVEPHTAQGPVLTVEGADLMDRTPILDIKPYVPYADAYPEADGSFASATRPLLAVQVPDALLVRIPRDLREGLVQTLAQDPRPGYAKEDSEREYRFRFDRLDIWFRVSGGAVTVTNIRNEEDNHAFPE